MSKILVVGSVAYDSIETPKTESQLTLGGSANYFSLAASIYSQVNVVGVVGNDYKNSDLERITRRGVDVTGLQQVEGETFRWKGKYEKDMNEAITLETHLNVFEHFNPEIPADYRNSEYVFLANIHPSLQMKVLDQIENPKFVALDTMNYWIDSAVDELKTAIKKIDALLINEGEARHLAGTWNTIDAAQILADMGPKVVVIKRGEYGFTTYNSENGEYFSLPAFPVKNVIDPTGAGDTFAGGFFGYLSGLNMDWSWEAHKQACIHGSLMASFTVEGFGVTGLEKTSWNDLQERLDVYFETINYGTRESAKAGSLKPFFAGDLA